MEVDVIGIRPNGREEIIACEVATHLRGVNYGNSQESRDRLFRKFRDTEKHVTKMVDSGNEVRFELWSPVVRSGLVEMLEELATNFEAQYDRSLQMVVNERYSEKIKLLEDKAASTAAQDNELAFRFLQILQHLRGR